MISPRTPWRIKTYFICLILILVSYSAFAGVGVMQSQHKKWLEHAEYKPFYRAFYAPTMNKYTKFCAYPRQMQIDYLDQKRLLASQNDIMSAFQYGALATFAPCLNINKMVGKNYLRKAADAGFVDAYYLLALMHKKDNNKDMQYAALMGHPKAAYNIAIMNDGVNNAAIHDVRNNFLYGVESDIKRAKHDYALFILKNTYLQDAEIHYVHNLLKDVISSDTDITLKAHAAYNIYLLQERHPQIHYSKKDKKTLFRLAHKYGLVSDMLHAGKKTKYKKKAYHVEQKHNMHSQKKVEPKTDDAIIWKDQQIMKFGKGLF